jgi:hypothetical protein
MDSPGNTNIRALTLFSFSPSHGTRIFYAGNPTIASNYTVALTGASAFGALCILPPKGMRSNSASDQAAMGATGASDSTSLAAGVITFGRSNQMLVSTTSFVTPAHTSGTIDSGFTKQLRISTVAGAGFGLALTTKLCRALCLRN